MGLPSTYTLKKSNEWPNIRIHNNTSLMYAQDDNTTHKCWDLIPMTYIKMHNEYQYKTNPKGLTSTPWDLNWDEWTLMMLLDSHGIVVPPHNLTPSHRRGPPYIWITMRVVETPPWIPSNGKRYSTNIIY